MYALILILLFAGMSYFGVVGAPIAAWAWAILMGIAAFYVSRHHASKWRDG